MIMITLSVRWLRTCLLVFMISLVAGSQASWGQRRVSGTVRTGEGAALAGASIVLRKPTSGLQRYGQASDQQGHFEISGILPGLYDLSVSFVGFSTETLPVDLRATDRSGMAIVLDSQTLPQSEVIVSTRRTQRRLHPVTVSNVSAEELDRMPDMKDLPVLLSRQPSITFHSENGNGIGYSTMRMRGFGQRRLAISINGVPQNDPEEFNVFWINFFDIQSVVEDIQIQRGAGSSTYGPAAIGGAINIRAMPYRPYSYAKAEIGGGAFNTRRYSFEANSGLMKGSYVLFGRISRLLSDGYRDWSWTEFWRFFAGVTRYGARSTLTLQAYGGPQRDGLAFAGIPKAANEETIEDIFGTVIDRRYNFSALTRDVENFHQPHLELHHELTLSDRTRLNQVLFLIQGKGYFDFGGTFRSADYLRLPEGFTPGEERSLPLYLTRPDVSVLFRAFLDQWQVGWIPTLTFIGEKSTTSVGAEFRLHRSLRWGRIQEADGLPANLVGSESDMRVYSFRGEKAIAAVYGSTLVRPTDRWAIQADLQLTLRQYRVYDEAFFGNHFRKPYLFLNPRIGVTYNPEHPVSAYASIALANREPRMKSLYDGEEAGAGFTPAFAVDADGSVDTDNPNVEAERLIDVELGVLVDKANYRVSANVFYMDFRDEIVPSGGLDQFGVPRTGNADHTRHVGIELAGAVRLAPGLDIEGNFTLSRNRFESFDEYVYLPDFSTVLVSRDGNPIAGFPDRSGNLGVTYSRAGFVVNLHASLVGRQYADNGGGMQPDGFASDDLVIDSFILVDASVRYAFSPASAFAGLRLGVDVNNLLDDRVLTYGNVGAVGPQFFPAATRHVFFSASYTLR